MQSSASHDRYIQQVRAIPKLSREVEHELAIRAGEGDQNATDRLVEANLRYVIAIALQYRRYGITLGDLIAEGILQAISEVDVTVPIVVRLEGTNAVQGLALIEQSGLAVQTASDLTEAAEKVVAVAGNTG